jgi:hypothetical protein
LLASLKRISRTGACRMQLNSRLWIDGLVTPIDSAIAIRWHDTAEEKSVPVLYRNGKRVTKRWFISFTGGREEDKEGANANTE